MRAILIDPFEKTVTEVEHNGNYRHIYELISHETMPVETYTAVGLNDERDAVFVDDEGLLKDDPPCTHFFLWKGYGQPLAGKGLILGCNDEGDSVEPTITLAQARAMVTFRDDIVLDHFWRIDGFVDHPISGPNTPMVGHTPVFTTIKKE